jgi:hypothetical protein
MIFELYVLTLLTIARSVLTYPILESMILYVYSIRIQKSHL